MPDEPKDLHQISQEDVDSVGERLKEWIPTLPEQEQLVLGWVLTRAAAAEDKDVADYAQRAQGGVPVSDLLAEAAGLQEVGGYAMPQAGRVSAMPDIGPVKIWTFKW
jgi:hypothetical protein